MKNTIGKFGKLFCLMLFVISMLALAGCGGNDQGSDKTVQSKEKWVVAINATFPPFESVESGTNKFVGIDIDIANYIAQRMNKTLEFKDMKFASLVPTLQSGRADIIISGISPTAQRKEVIDFTKSYYFPMKAIICRKGAGLDTMEKLQGKTAGASMGTSFAKQLKEFGGINVAELDSTPLVIQDINNNRLDAGLFDSAQAAVFIKENPNLEMHILQQPMTIEDTYAIALPKNSPDKAEIEKILQEMKENGELHKILVKYLGEEQTQQYEQVTAQLDIAK